MVLDVGLDARMRFRHPTEFAFPAAIEDDPVDMATPRVRLPAFGARRVELDVRRRTGGVVGIEDGLDRVGFEHGLRNRRGDAVAGHIGQFLVDKLRRFRPALANQAAVEPLLGDAL